MKTRLVALLGLINKNDEVLISLRKNTNEYNNYWEYPGGKVEASETVDQALEREIKEELNIDISSNCVAPLAFAVDSSESSQTVLLLHVCRKWQGTPFSSLDQKIEWVRPINLFNYKMPASNVFLNSILRDWLSSI